MNRKSVLTFLGGSALALVVATSLTGCASSGDGGDDQAAAGGAALSAPSSPSDSTGAPFTGTFTKSDTSDGVSARLVMKSATSTQLTFDLHWQKTGDHSDFGDNTGLKAKLGKVGDQDNALFQSGSDCSFDIEFNPAHNHVVVSQNQDSTCTDALGFGAFVNISGDYDLQ